jgi:CubicO group peptidase (beta-lactamase class C family)
MVAPIACGREMMVAMDEGWMGEAARTVLLRDGGTARVAGDGRERQPVFSITKMFIAVACLRLAGQRLLGLDKDARRWLPAVPAGLTVRQLLGHTGGLPDYPATGDYRTAVAARPAEPWDLPRILAVTLAQPRSAPGPFRYCNTGYWMLGAILERAAGTSLAHVLATEVFGPAAMSDSAYPDAGASITADGYSTLWAGPAGAAWSTAYDLDRFLSALLNGILLAPHALTAMRHASLVEPHPPWAGPGYGLGVMTDAVLHTIGHGGGGPGYQTAAFALATGTRAAVVIARSSSKPDPVRQAIRWLTQ